MEDNLTIKDRLIIKIKSRKEFPASAILVFALALSCLLGLSIAAGYRKLPRQLDNQETVDYSEDLQLAAVASSDIPKDLKLNFYGSLTMDQGLRRYLKETDFSRFFSQINPLLASSDLNIINLESPLDLSERRSDSFYPSDLESLRSYNFQLFPLANTNFCPAKGAPADLQLEALAQLPISFIGFGQSTSQAAGGQRYPYGESGVSIFSTSAMGRNQRASQFESGMSIATDIQVFDRVTRAKINGDFVVVMIHWGQLPNSGYSQYQQSLAQRYIDAGADLIIGAAPGPATGLEAYKEGLICYNLGSLQQSTNDGLVQPGFMLELKLDRETPAQVNLYPLSQSLGLPALDSKNHQLDLIKDSALNQLANFSSSLNPDGSLTITYFEKP